MAENSGDIMDQILMDYTTDELHSLFIKFLGYSADYCNEKFLPMAQHTIPVETIINRMKRETTHFLVQERKLDQNDPHYLAYVERQNTLKLRRDLRRQGLEKRYSTRKDTFGKIVF